MQSAEQNKWKKYDTLIIGKKTRCSYCLRTRSVFLSKLTLSDRIFFTGWRLIQVLFDITEALVCLLRVIFDLTRSIILFAQLGADKVQLHQELLDGFCFSVLVFFVLPELLF
uniref:AlNc14C195G8556 protein n=1 Tax=Albugo laibachii Nc14 TaxID=890382 RepID=F0WQ75_9STRA|nr:AlNc14C195G8556 [Albugo laibachii Nc14]CCA26697.1 AlNc14C403G11394 [Albugo laibachii Nc14]|eukprot:CCA26697.1 AlNc14C403G11394 [Albugo laibachii Nc14]